MKSADAAERYVKGYTADSVKAESDGFSWTISTGAIDRDHDTLAVDGWDLTAYRKNPVVLWAHDSRQPPIAKAESILVTGGALKARTVFPEPGVYALADTVKALVAGGFIKTTSVGFIPMEWTFNEARGGVDFKRQSLLEFSLVPVPSNPEALIDAKRAGIDMKAVIAWAEGVLDDHEPGLWVPKARALEAFKVLAEPRVVVPSTFAKVVEAVAVKAGRTLSAANAQRLSDALTSIEDSATSIEAAAELIEEVLDLATPATGDEPEKAGPVLRVIPSRKLKISRTSVKAAVVAAVTDGVRAELRAARGRLD